MVPLLGKSSKDSFYRQYNTRINIEIRIDLQNIRYTGVVIKKP